MTCARSKWVVPIPVVDSTASVAQKVPEMSGLATKSFVRWPKVSPTRRNRIVPNGTMQVHGEIFAQVASTKTTKNPAMRPRGASCNQVSLSSATRTAER